MTANLLSHDQLIAMRQEQTIEPLIDLIKKVQQATTLNTTDSKTRFCDFCHVTVPKASDSYSVGAFDFCHKCHTQCQECDTNTMAEILFRRNVAEKLPSARHGIDNHLETQYCDACLTLVAVGTLLNNHFGNRMIFCDPCVEQIRRESKDDFATMQSFPCRPHNVDLRKQQLKGVKSC